jgi:hypothetical protein
MELPMKHTMVVFVTLIAACGASTQSSSADYITVEPQWVELDYNAPHFHSSWILIGNVTFKKRSKEPACMEQMVLQWKGPQIDGMLGSLYKKSVDKQFLPIEDNLVCDGCWNKTKQQLSFKFCKRQNLRATNIFCIVLTLPSNLINRVRQGRFEIESDHLPTTFKTALNCPLSLSLKHRPT